MDELTPERLRQIEGRWKSDVDLKLDRLVRFADAYEGYLKLCLERETERKAMRRAIIEKTLIGLVWAAVVFVGVSTWHSLRAALK